MNEIKLKKARAIARQNGMSSMEFSIIVNELSSQIHARLTARELAGVVLDIHKSDAITTPRREDIGQQGWRHFDGCPHPYWPAGYGISQAQDSGSIISRTV